MLARRHHHEQCWGVTGAGVSSWKLSLPSCKAAKVEGGLRRPSPGQGGRRSSTCKGPAAATVGQRQADGADPSPPRRPGRRLPLSSRCGPGDARQTGGSLTSTTSQGAHESGSVPWATDHSDWVPSRSALGGGEAEGGTGWHALVGLTGSSGAHGGSLEACRAVGKGGSGSQPGKEHTRPLTSLPAAQNFVKVPGQQLTAGTGPRRVPTPRARTRGQVTGSHGPSTSINTDQGHFFQGAAAPACAQL